MDIRGKAILADFFFFLRPAIIGTYIHNLSPRLAQVLVYDRLSSKYYCFYTEFIFFFWFNMHEKKKCVPDAVIENVIILCKILHWM